MRFLDRLTRGDWRRGRRARAVGRGRICGNPKGLPRLRQLFDRLVYEDCISVRKGS